MSSWSWGYDEPLSQDHRNYLLTSGAPPYPSPKQLTKCILIHVMDPSTSYRPVLILIHEIIFLISRLSRLTFLQSIKVRLCAQCMMIISSLFSSTPFLHSKFFFYASLCIPALVYSANYTFFCGIVRLLWCEGFETSVSVSRFNNLINFFMKRKLEH